MKYIHIINLLYITFHTLTPKSAEEGALNNVALVSSVHCRPIRSNIANRQVRLISAEAKKLLYQIFVTP